MALGLLVFLAGCSGTGGTVDDRGIFKPDKAIPGEIKPAGEAEFLAGDYKAAKPLLTEAGRNGSLRAVFYLRIIVEIGLDGEAPNAQEADRLVTLMGAMKSRLEDLAFNGPGADQGIYLTSLAIAYFRGKIEGGPDLQRALRLAREAASRGFIPGVNLAAAILVTPGVEAGVIKDLWGGGLNEAFNLSHSAALKNDVLAMGNVGYLYRVGQGVSLDAYQGASWSRKAAQIPQTTPRVLNDLGAVYEEGRAVTPDKDEALRWYGLAAARGYKMGANNQARLRSGKGGSPEVLTGLEY
ncbi:MAG: sel1 repeat family protein [Deltaproteobacteria bacterium]|nr:sel1 repeat family protein [Deltaproteobacteria bacterium]